MEHYFSKIEGWFKFAPAYRRAVADAPSPAVFVEVGCYKGRSTAFLAVEIINSAKSIALHCVDLWPDSDEVATVGEAPSTSLIETFRENLAPAAAQGLFLMLHPEGSPDSAAKFSDGSLDFGWLDGGHSYEEVRADLRAWVPKLKEGGVIGGDDWLFPNVARAVREAFQRDIEVRYHDNWAWWWHHTKGRRAP